MDFKELAQWVVNAPKEDLRRANQLLVEEIKARNDRENRIAKAQIMVSSRVRLTKDDRFLGIGTVTEMKGKKAIVRFDSKQMMLYSVPYSMLVIA